MKNANGPCFLIIKPIKKEFIPLKIKYFLKSFLGKNRLSKVFIKKYFRIAESFSLKKKLRFSGAFF